MMRSDQVCEHGYTGGKCPDEKCPGYWLDATGSSPMTLARLAEGDT